MDGVPRHFLEMICVYKATAFALLSVSNVLKEENKPLFGAFNTRQVSSYHHIGQCYTEWAKKTAIWSFFGKNFSPQNDSGIIFMREIDCAH
jgi:hypothetical protein